MPDTYGTREAPTTLSLVAVAAGGVAAGFAFYVKLHNDSVRASRPSEHR